MRVENMMYVYIYAVSLCTHTISMLCYMYASIVYVPCSMECMYMYTNICDWDRMSMHMVQFLNIYMYMWMIIVTIIRIISLLKFSVYGIYSITCYIAGYTHCIHVDIVYMGYK